MARHAVTVVMLHDWLSPATNQRVGLPGVVTYLLTSVLILFKYHPSLYLVPVQTDSQAQVRGGGGPGKDN